MFYTTKFYLKLCAVLLVLSSAAGQISPKAAPYKWVALGDSYSAGPGAGSDYDESGGGSCMRTRGGYPARLQQRMLNDESFDDPDLSFLSCTGDKMPDMKQRSTAPCPSRAQFCYSLYWW